MSQVLLMKNISTVHCRIRVMPTKMVWLTPHQIFCIKVNVGFKPHLHLYLIKYLVLFSGSYRVVGMLWTKNLNLRNFAFFPHEWSDNNSLLPHKNTKISNFIKQFRNIPHKVVPGF